MPLSNVRKRIVKNALVLLNHRRTRRPRYVVDYCQEHAGDYLVRTSIPTIISAALLACAIVPAAYASDDSGPTLNLGNTICQGDEQAMVNGLLCRAGGDTDADGVGDASDNCRDISNPAQQDGDADGFGNLCDGDLNNDCMVDFSDLAQMKAVFFTNDAVADLNADGDVNFVDFGLLKTLLFLPPGPSGLVSECVALAPPLFEEMSDALPAQYSGPSFGASWGDVNADGWPDIWFGNHSAGVPQLYLNDTEGGFTDEIGRVTNLANFQSADLHGAAWADFDADGDEDLLVMVGAQSGSGQSGNVLLVNEQGLTLTNDAPLLGLDYAFGRGRMPLWLDPNGDGDMDVLLANWPRADDQAPTTLMTQLAGTFQDDGPALGLVTDQDNNMAQLIYSEAFAGPVLMIHGLPGFPDRVYDFDVQPWTDLTALFGLDSNTEVREVAVGDVDGDLRADVIGLRSSFASFAEMADSRSVWGRLAANGGEIGLRFRPQGDVEFIFGPTNRIDPDQIFIGASGMPATSLSFTLAADDPAVLGIAPHGPNEPGVFVGIDEITGEWVLIESVGPTHNLKIIAEQSITDLVLEGFTSSNGERSDILYLQSDTQFDEASAQAGLDMPSACESVAAADFDNDADLDLYLVCRGQAFNLPNLLYENLGAGSFQLRMGHGAEGSQIGRGDVVAIADYDRDGFLDLALTNGRGESPFNDGPNQLFRNVGNSNHWLQIDLIGTVSNIHGVGARVTLDADGVVQVRDQGGGVRRGTQDHQRLHFGLGEASTIQVLSIAWPSGIVQTLNNVAADQIMQIVEPAPVAAGIPVNTNGLSLRR